MVFSAVATTCSILVFIFLIYSKQAITSVFLTFLAIAVAIYLIGNHIEISNDSIEAAKAGLFVRLIAIPFIPTLWYFCVREFCGLKFKKTYTMFLLLVVPIVIAYLYLTWEQNNLLISSVHYLNGDNNGNLILNYGPLNNYKVIYQIGIQLFGVATIIRCYRKGTKRFKKQSILFMASIMIPIFNISTYVVKIGGLNIDITPYGLLLSMVLFTVSLYWFGVINQSDIVKDNAFNHLFEGLILFDKHGTYMDANYSAVEIFPELGTVSLGTNIEEMCYLPFGVSALKGKTRSDNHVCEFSTEYHGGINTFNVSISQILKQKSGIGYCVIINNITPMKKILSTLEEKSVTDSLTGIYNRGYLAEAGESVMKNAKLINEPFCVIMLDIDFFKKVNDNYGHPYGDYVLKVIAQLCAGSFRKSDIVIRYGGEEFCILLLNTSIEGACKKAEALRQKIGNYMFNADGIKAEITVSLGVAQYKEEHETFEDVVKIADNNLYISKKSGRNRVT